MYHGFSYTARNLCCAKLPHMPEPEKTLTTEGRKLVVLGTAHQLQGKNMPRGIDDGCFRDTVGLLICANELDFVFEEAAGHAPTNAELLAKAARSTPIGYMDVDPSIEERKQHGLAEVTGGDYVVDLSQEPICVPKSEFVGEHAAREEFWLKKICAQKFTFALMVCGDAHCLSFSFRLVAAGFKVEKCLHYLPYDKLCRHVVLT
jgi:hypothetical protein